MATSDFKLERALQDLIQAQSDIAALIAASASNETPFDVYTAIDDGTINFDCVVVTAMDAASRNPYDGMIGNWDVSISVKLFTSIKDDTIGRDDHISRYNAIQNLLMDDGIKASINAISSGLVIGNPKPFSRGHRIQNDCWISELTITVPCRDGE